MKKTKEVKTNDKVIDDLYNAAVRYVESRGGTAVVVGGIALVDEGYAKYNYGVMVRMTGKKPVFSEKKP